MNIKDLLNNSKVVVAVVGPKASGKSTLCNHFNKDCEGKVPTKVLSFATALKEICAQAFEQPLESMYGDKEVPFIRPIHMKAKFYKRILVDMQQRLQNMGIVDFDWRKVAINLYGEPDFETPRQMLQWVGTEFMQSIYPAFHCLILKGQMQDNGVYYIDDCRFTEEYGFLKESFPNFYVMKIRGRNEDNEDTHASEAGWQGMPCDIEINNTSAMSVFCKAGDDALEGYLKDLCKAPAMGIESITETIMDDIIEGVETLVDPETQEIINVQQEVATGKMKKVGNFIFRHKKKSAS